MQTLNVFIASTEQAQSYRKSVKIGIQSWNELFGAQRGAQFEATDWHDLVASSDPAMQEQIYRKLIDRADVLVGVLASTAGNKNTLREIERARKSGKRVFVFLAANSNP